VSPGFPHKRRRLAGAFPFSRAAAFPICLSLAYLQGRDSEGLHLSLNAGGVFSCDPTTILGLPVLVQLSPPHLSANAGAAITASTDTIKRHTMSIESMRFTLFHPLSLLLAFPFQERQNRPQDQ